MFIIPLKLGLTYLSIYECTLSSSSSLKHLSTIAYTSLI
jgi:hypothetical protein